VNNNNHNTWPKAITVDKRIVRILSSSTYSNFPSAIREIIVNGYDADAEVVNLEFDLKNSILSITDYGKGMNEKEFTLYLRIAGKSRKKEETTTKSNRRIIGQFGVGFLSVLPFCEKYLIETTKKGSEEVVSATISSGDYFNDDFTSIDVDRIPINGGVQNVKEKLNQSYTRIRLVGFSKLTKAFLNREYTLKSKKNTIKNFEPLDLLKWELQEYLPIEYNTNTSIGNELNELSNDYSQKPFKVFFNGEELFRNIHAQKILEKSKDIIEIGSIKFKYFISTNYAPISPTEARYLLIRNLNIGVGDRTSFEIGMDGKVYGKLAHLTGEILVEHGLNDLISVSRDKFNYSLDYEKLKEFFRDKLRNLANQLDNIKSIENLLVDFQNESKVSNLDNLKKEFITKKISKLESSGFQIIRDDESVISSNGNTGNKKKSFVTIDKIDRKIHITNSGDIVLKNINVGNFKYKLKVDIWDYKNSEYPALILSDRIVTINENYPLFKDKNKIDIFIKLNILLLKSLNENKINKTTYSSFMNDLLTTFND